MVGVSPFLWVTHIAFVPKPDSAPVAPLSWLRSIKLRGSRPGSPNREIHIPAYWIQRNAEKPSFLIGYFNSYKYGQIIYEGCVNLATFCIICIFFLLHISAW